MTTLVVLAPSPALGADAGAALAIAEASGAFRWITARAPGALEPHPARDADASWLIPEAAACRHEVAPSEVAAYEARLVTEGRAYPCSCPKERLAAVARQCLTDGQPPRYDGFCRGGAAGGPVLRLRLREGPEDLVDRRLDGVAPIVVAGSNLAATHLVAEPAAAPLARLALHLGDRPATRTWERTPRVIGPDGAPLVRASQPSAVAWLRVRGFRPEAVRAFFRRGTGHSVLSWDEELLDQLNHEALLALDAGTRRHELRDALRAAGLGDTVDLDAAWNAIAPRIRRWDDAGRLLGFLHERWRPPEIDGRDHAILDPIVAALEDDATSGASGEILTAIVEGLTHRRHDLVCEARRALRWALTGQDVAPPLATVWDLLGRERARARLRGALARAADAAAKIGLSGSRTL